VMMILLFNFPYCLSNATWTMFILHILIDKYIFLGCDCFDLIIDI
jgi:hypothetical protein